MADSVLEMSDDEIMNMSNPPELDETKDTQPIEENEQELTGNEQNEQEIEESSPYEEDIDNSPDNSDNIQSNDNEQQEPDYEGFYKRVMAPFKANGKQYNLKNADEVISLMQKGVDYTRKTQDIARYKKSIAMLERANLLNEHQISFFIDLMNGNQEAIRKLLKDKEIDTFDLPSEDEPINYVEGANIISDAQLAIQDITRDIVSQQGGNAFLQEVFNYDEASKQRVFEEPQILQVLFNQKQNGIYDAIVNEMERQRILGQIPPGIPFIAAYKVIGDMLYKGKGNKPLARKPAITSNQLNNSQRAKSAGLTRFSSRTAKASNNFLKMSDEEFLKQFGE